jgi:hypothetical protein
MASLGGLAAVVDKGTQRRVNQMGWAQCPPRFPFKDRQLLEPPLPIFGRGVSFITRPLSRGSRRDRRRFLLDDAQGIELLRGARNASQGKQGLP